MQDRIYRYIAADGNVRILLAATTGAVEDARRLHGASPVATAAMGRVLTMALMMASELKGNGSITATVAGDGPIGRICAVARPDGSVKCYCANPQAPSSRRDDGKLDVGAAVGRRGKLTVVRDLGMREPWVGQVNLASGEIGEDFALYLAASEQQPSVVALGVFLSTDRAVMCAGGIVVQPLPGCPEETLALLEALAPTLGDISRRLMELGPEGLVESVFDGMEPVLSGDGPAVLRCDCSRERIERALVTLGEGELADMMEKDGGAEVCCHFCNGKYAFSAGELETLITAAQQSKGE